MKTIKISNDFYLCEKTIERESSKVNVPQQTNHIFVVDVSGSMYYDLPLIRKQLKNKLPSLMKDGDTISIVWFSGNKEAGVLIEEVEIKSLTTFTHINDAIDRWLKPIGLTAFNKPLELTLDIINEIQQNRPNGVFSLIFLTDGYNNDCSYSDVKKTLEKLAPKLSSSLFVEYGFYADSKRLTEMASIMGGEKISCDNFDEFDPVFSNKLTQDLFGGKKILVELDTHFVHHDFAYSVDNNGSVILYSVDYTKEKPTILVNDNVQNIYWFSLKGSNQKTIIDYTPLYAGIYILSDKILNDDVELLLGYLGDVYFYETFVNAFGKQKLNEFKNNIKSAITNYSERFVKGQDISIKVNENAFCLMNLIKLLSNFKEKILFYPNHSSFNYNRIGRKKLAVGSKLTESEQKELSEIKNVNELSEKIDELKKTKVDLKFVPFNYTEGYPISDLVWNESRANLSVRVRTEGEVDLPKNEFNLDKITTFIYRTYTIIKDGIININELPLSYNESLVQFLDENNVNYTIENDIYSHKPTYLIVNLKSLPVINKRMVKSISANELAELEWDLLKLRAEKKAIDYFKNLYFPKTSTSYVQMVGVDAAHWLKEIGITDYNGFAPKTEYDEAKDTYVSVNLETKIKGYSTLPKVIDVVNKIKEDKELKPTEDLMSDVIEHILGIIKDDGEGSEKLSKKLFYLSNKANNDKNVLLQRIAEIKFALILSKRWFKEFKSFDEDSITINKMGREIDFTFKLIEKEEKV